ncbi:Uncharacterised protein [Actinobacillus pleuropneumoniae]|uniref:hypothetical protein n=1 Tax=Actinobacillus pleuropneumoniae TaxID=715 RepID=UPI0001E4A4B0|nr:hypothetical protein [Actinobacillus pleuropneumoniae]EFM88700.1 hypothetical protein appser4_21460 [Actinobacillus pleuropneumoniae serovar 4 str. M62]SQF65671.1 Uncharacterised protein [Actinobacillus pleuropneumoniae]
MTYSIQANNVSGAFCSGGTATSLTAAIKKARNTFAAGWKISIWANEECVKTWVTRK